MSRILGTLVVLFSLLASFRPAHATSNLAMTFTPYPAKSCSNVTANWSGTFDNASDLYFQLINDKAPGTVFWQSPLQSVSGVSSGQFTLRTFREWPASNSKEGAVYKVRSVMNGVEYASDALPILENKKSLPPVANDSNASGLEDELLTGTLFATDPDGELLTFGLVAGSPDGALTIDSLEGSFSFTPALNWFGTTSFSYFARDCQHESIGTVWVTIEPVNDAPVAMDGAAQGDEDTLISVQAVGTDIEESPLLYTVTAESLNGQVTMNAATGSFEFISNQDWFGTTSFGFRVFDGEMWSEEATVTLIVNPVNDVPVSYLGAFVGNEDEILTGNFIGFDVEGDTLVFTILTTPNENEGTLEFDANTGSFTFQPALNWNGEATLSYTVSDSLATSEPSDVTITILPLNDVPIAVAANMSTLEDTALNGNLVASDVDSSVLTYSIIDSPASGVLELDTETGSFIFTPALNFFGAISFNFSASDGSAASLPATVNIDVTPVNDSPTAEALTFFVDEDQWITRFLQGNDVDGDAVSFQVEKNPTGGALELDSETGSFTFTPDPNVSGLSQFTYIVSDGEVSSGAATVQLLVAPINDLPMAYAAFFTGAGDTVLSGLLTGTDIESEFVSYELVQAPSQGSLQIDASTGVFTYAPVESSAGDFMFTFRVNDGIDVSEEATVILTILPGGGTIVLPPDPATVAPAISMTGETSPYDSMSFLFTGAHPIQTGVMPGTITEKRISVIRGQVLDINGEPLPGATVTISGHPEFGQTLSRMDGRYDIAMNGGAHAAVSFTKNGYLEVQRLVKTDWADYSHIDPIVLTAMDPVTSLIDLSNQVMQVATGSVVTDESGSRQPVLLFAKGTTASVVFPNGATTALSQLTVRITEFTVGDKGLEAMPAILPKYTQYMYAAEYQVDEAYAMGSTKIVFSKPVIQYLDNFLDFPVGALIPMGFYDRIGNSWTGSEDGFVIQIVGFSNGKALIDVSGDGLPESEEFLATVNFTQDELYQLSGIYPPGKMLWRVRLPHFSIGDMNSGLGFDPNLAQGPQLGGSGGSKGGPSTCSKGSIIYCENQALGESIPIVGTPFNLSYNSERVPGRANILRIPLKSSNLITDNIESMEVSINVAGNQFKFSFPKPNFPDYYDFEWDGRDAYGRLIQGEQPVQYVVKYMYKVEEYSFDKWCAGNGSALGCIPRLCDYDTPFPFCLFSFGQNPSVLYKQFVNASGQRTNRKIYYVTRASNGSGKIGRWNAKEYVRMGGFQLDAHHGYDSAGHVLFKGDGTDRYETQILGNQIGTFWGGGANFANGVSALDSRLNTPRVIAVAPDGTVYSNHDFCMLRALEPDGKVRTVLGKFTSSNQTMCGFSGDGGPAVNALTPGIQDIAVDREGAVYVAERYRIRKISTDGVITTIAGTGNPSTGNLPGEGVLGSTYNFADIQSIIVDKENNLYIADGRSSKTRVRKLDTNGILFTVAGGGNLAYSNKMMATDLSQFERFHLALSADDDLYLAFGSTFSFFAVAKLDSSGRLITVAGGGTGTGDGILATAAKLGQTQIVFGSDGLLYLSERSVTSAGPYWVRNVSSDGIISIFAGELGQAGFSGDGDRAAKARFRFQQEVAALPDGRMLIADTSNNRLRVVASPQPGFTNGDLLIPSDTGNEAFQFSASGRHLRTFDSLTSAVIYSFHYSPEGLLTEVRDRNGLSTLIERDFNGDASAIVGPYGQRTELVLDENKFLASLINPNQEAYNFDFSDLGLMQLFQTPRGSTSTFDWDAEGKLLADHFANGGVKTIAPNGVRDVTLYDPLNRAERHSVLPLAGGSRIQQVTNVDGTVRSTLSNAAGQSTVSSSDGMVETRQETADTRFGIQAPVVSRTVRTPSGLSNIGVSTRSSTLTDIANPLSLATHSEFSTTNGRVSMSTYTRALNSRVSTSPQGRTATQFFDEMGRVVRSETPGIAATLMAFDSLGRVYSVDQGGRETLLSYDQFGRTQSITDPLLRSVSFSYDSANRVVSQTLPDGRFVEFLYDPMGNLTSVTPPGKTPHTFSFSPVDLVTGYDAPDAADGAGVTQYAYNLAKQLTSVTRPDGVVVSYLYEGDAGLPLPNPNTGRLKRITQPRGNTDFGYGAAGRLSTITAPDNGKLTYGYDGSLLLSTTWSNGAVNGSVSRTYNTRTFVENGVTKTGSDFWITSESVNGANAVSFGYDLDGLLTSAGALTISRNAQNGLITGSSIGGISDSISYNGFAEPIGYNATFNGSSLYNVSYVRDAIGRISSKTETVNGVTDVYDYEFDPQGSKGYLTKVNKNGLPYATYSYDSNGNRLSYSGVNGSASGIYDAQDRMLSYGDTQYEYTTYGELTKKTNTASGSVWEFSYDAFNDLMSAKLPNGTTVEYVVDAQYRRIGKKVNGVLKQGFLYGDQLQVLAELDGNGSVVSRFAHHNKMNVPEYMVKGGRTYRIVTDHLGSPRLVVDVASGTVAQELEFDEFGRKLLDTNPGFQPFGYAGGLEDLDTGLIRFGARDYDPETGRWTTKDPIRFEGRSLNFYTYVGNDPINFVDPTGFKPLSECVKDILSPFFNQGVLDTMNAIPLPFSIPDRTDAITLGDNVFFSYNKFNQDSVAGVTLIAHELMHIYQQQLLGKLSFYNAYIKEHFKNGYDNNPFELQADAMEERVKNALKAQFPSGKIECEDKCPK